MLFSRQCYAPGEQFADPVYRPVGYDVKDIAEVAFWLHSVQFARPDQAVHGVVIQGTAYGCGSDATDAVLPGHTPYQSAYRSLSEAGSDRLPFVRYGGRLFRNDCRSSSGGVYPAAPADGLFRAPGCSAFPAGRGSALPVRPGAVSAGRCRQKRCRS
ncbi:Hypothetical protein c3579 [Escherichia coli CFT073]|uniref:Uncharacterized protein n=1 Tax=Escherichia coli O6:H1 (strain CFT073 / ATCC 700928 / UPEC) TaxID=199310 RepID=A0A0H2VCZ8_ECOL6|nr:Hypothetical protein c3579 [Escherichia coli CFT073]